MNLLIFLLILAAVFAIVSLCMTGVGERNSFRSWIAVFFGAILLAGVFGFMSYRLDIMSNAATYAAFAHSFFAVLFGLVALKYLIDIGMNKDDGQHRYSLILRAYLSAVIFLSLVGVMSWGIAIGGAIALLGYPLIHRLEQQPKSVADAANNRSR
ncbi:hypothetical protein [Rubellicoccus peritrichatus]|uniref:Uncharacterized protein n=1 Tax=Rubellicoccus peritrichatus TaxID=3080537 RepID=A0AAQ3LBT8_9BACT|nr:hypothetical protein [Puniceicoccus sp. CR14]WOO42876.1 hypothetical protein RZN69_07210 [Puniceicoccus sp. CR14]